MEVYNQLARAVTTLRSKNRFFDHEAYADALRTLQEYVQAVAKRDHLPYTLYPESEPSTFAADWDCHTAAEAIHGTLLDHFLEDFVGFTLRLEALDVVAFSASNAFQLASSLFIARLMKKAGVRAPILLGGHAVALAGASFRERPEVAGAFDVVILQGGADVFVRACEDLIAGRLQKTYSSSAGTSRGNPKGFPVDRPYDLMLRRDAQGFYLSPYEVFSIFSAVGCSYGACVFCGSNRKASPYIPREIGILVDEIERLQSEHGISCYNICDNNFDPERSNYFCQELERRGTRIFWQCTTRVYREMDTALLQRMKDCGCVLINFGMESASNRILKRMRKGYTVDDVQALLESAEAVKMKMHTYCICAFPSENEEESQDTIEFLRRNAARWHSVYFQNYTVELAAKVFAKSLSVESHGYTAPRMIEELLKDPGIAQRCVTHGNLLRQKGFPRIEDHNFLYLAFSRKKERALS